MSSQNVCLRQRLQLKTKQNKNRKDVVFGVHLQSKLQVELLNFSNYILLQKERKKNGIYYFIANATKIYFFLLLPNLIDKIAR